MTDTLKMNHLSERARALAMNGEEDRISHIYNWMWVHNSSAEKVEAICRRMLTTHNPNQAPCLLVVGPTGIGKTALLKHLEKHVFSKNRAIIYFDPRYCTTYKAFLAQFSKNLNIHVPPKQIPTNAVLEAELARVLLLRGVKAIVIDNLHDLMRGNSVNQRNTLTFLRELSCGSNPVLLLCFGIEKVMSSIRSDEQLERRLCIYSMPVWQDDSNFLEFLAVIESELPLRKPSGLTDRSKVGFLIAHSHGVTSGIIEPIKHAAIYAITSGEERISLAALKIGASAPFQQEGW